jgi:hypothetical protein
MAFTIEMENPAVITILNSLETRCSVLPIEVSEQGLGLNVSSDGKAMAFSMMLNKNMFKEFVFQGEGVEGVCLSAANFKKVSAKLAYPVEIQSGMSNGVKISSAVGRQSYNLRPVEDVIAEKAFGKSESIRKQLDEFKKADDGIVIKLLAQDLKMGLRNVAVGGKNVTMELSGNTLELTTDSVDIDAEATVDLIETVDGDWERTYNVGYLQSIVAVLSENSEIQLHLFDDTRSLLVYLPLSEEGESFCLVNVAPVQKRRGREDVEVENDETDED